jgi:hypothetical protein
MVRTILTDIGSALDFAHRQGVVHRDVKPGNILVEEEGFAVITDFGIAKAAESESLPRSGTTVGTPSYLSPEACAGDRVGPPADQYSLGIVGYEMITGQLPFAAESSLGMMYAQVHTPPRPSTDLRSDCPRDLHDTIMRMLEKSAEDRLASLKDATLELSLGQPPADEHVRSHIGLLAVPRAGRSAADIRRTPSSPLFSGAVKPTMPISSIRRRKRAQRLRIMAGAVGVLAVAAAVWGFEPRSGSRCRCGQRNHCTGSSRYLYLAARGAASYARQRAIAAGVNAAALRPGDSLQAKAESLATLGQRAGAAVLLTSAASLAGGRTARVADRDEGYGEPGGCSSTPSRRGVESRYSGDRRGPDSGRAGAFRFHEDRFLLSGAGGSHSNPSGERSEAPAPQSHRQRGEILA